MFSLATVFYIQTNEGVGRKIMRDGVRELQEERERAAKKKNSSSNEERGGRNCESGVSL